VSAQRECSSIAVTVVGDEITRYGFLTDVWNRPLRVTMRALLISRWHKDRRLTGVCDQPQA
jgi:hypothetical protein